MENFPRWEIKAQKTITMTIYVSAPNLWEAEELAADSFDEGKLEDVATEILCARVVKLDEETT